MNLKIAPTFKKFGFVNYYFAMIFFGITGQWSRGGGVVVNTAKVIYRIHSIEDSTCGENSLCQHCRVMQNLTATFQMS